MRPMVPFRPQPRTPRGRTIWREIKVGVLTRLRWPDFAARCLPLGSGFVESAAKWLIQQRFKGVGMRWSEDGSNNLLLLRLAWANDRFDVLFLPASPN
jgi:hypothetical protein